jgi:molybdenum cofactor biosynthesis protein B
MSVDQHHRDAPAHVSCFVLSISDTRTLDTDRSGQAIVETLAENGHVLAGRALLPDEPDQVRTLVREVLTDGKADAVITTGGTGIARRDSTYEALAGIFEREIPGFGELFRALSFEEIGPAAMLSRAAAGVSGGRVIFLLPGSEQAVRLALSRLVIPEIGHIVRELRR